MKSFFLLLFRPIKSFNDVKTDKKFPLIELIILLFFILINLILMIPVVEKVTSLTISAMPLSEIQMDTANQIAHKMRYLEVIGSEIIYVVMIFLYALILYAIAYIMKVKIEYKMALKLIVYSYLIITIGDLINTCLLFSRGLDEISNIYDTSLLGFNLFASIERVGPTLYTFLSYLNLFQLIFVVLLSAGLKIFAEIKYIKSLFICIVFWVISVLIPLLSVYYSQYAVANM